MDTYINNFVSSTKKQKTITLLFYAFLCLGLQLFIGWYQNFSDATHYLWIADRYAEGDWKNAINTYWGPMISWLLLILKPVISAPFVRFRILQVVLGGLAITFINNILNKKVENKKAAFVFSISVVPAIASYAWFYLTPDLLLLCGVLLLLQILYSVELDNNHSRLKLAAIGALLFFIKAMGLYLFVFVVAGKFIFERKQWNWKGFFGNIKIAVLLVLFIAPWIYLISVKHGHFTMGTGAEHNYKMNSPRITPDIYGELGNPHHNGTLCEPNPGDAFDSWMEPLQQPYMSWEGYSNEEIGKIYTAIVFKNLQSVRSMYFGLDIGTLFVFLVIGSFFINRKQLFLFFKTEVVLVIILLCNILLYLPFFFMDRYTWPGVFALFFLFIILSSQFKLLNKNNFITISFFIIFSLNVFSLYKEINYALPEKSVTTAIWNTKATLNLKRCVWLTDSKDKRLGLIKGLIYYNHGQYLGALFTDNADANENNKILNEFKIDYLISLNPIINDTLKQEYGIASTVFQERELYIYKRTCVDFKSKKMAGNYD